MKDRSTLLCAAAALGVLLSGGLELALQYNIRESDRALLFTLVVLGTALAVGLVRRVPPVSLGLVWMTAIGQAATATPFLLTQAAWAVIAFGLARWGDRAVLWASASSFVAGPVVAVVLIGNDLIWIDPPYASQDLFVATVDQLGLGWRIGAGVVFGALLAMPWLGGLTLRISRRARIDLDRASRERLRAEEIARVREAQTRLARDVHDVVGHSLAVILAQAESGRYLPDDDPTALKSALATIAMSARASLHDVREVLTATGDTTDDLDNLIDNLRAGGHEVVTGHDGTPRALPEPQRAAAYRVLQEMLTNAIRHGLRGGALTVRRTWSSDALQIEVRNGIEPAPGDRLSSPGSGSGLDGMRERLATIGGTLSTGVRGKVFVATARIPLS
ncbi:sensor histidine kinase [Actinoplanes italicus]|uniref:histidine kinase n=1 Tax=Actinoplanes italicus TaxID=113567 RepID=A0A2T0K6M5_9ACTN|nr:histidine kinase [Actinoplanes italicus]PRX18632.1 signal transduction histidine kinase [Actinoplanes italicus]